MNPTADHLIEVQQKLHRTTILRVYNYYRLLISFGFLYLFLDPRLNTFVGSINQGLFETTVLFYFVANSLLALATPFVRDEYLSSTAMSFSILVGDLICLTLLVSASGGVSSGLGNFIIFTLAFGGSLIIGRLSTVLPAIAFILTIYDEFYLYFLDKNDVQSFFQAGLLGVVFFVANILFQTLSRELRTRETEVSTLERINELVINKIPTGVVVISDTQQPRLLNEAAEWMLTEPGEQSARERLPQALLDRADAWSAAPTLDSVQFTPYRAGPDLVATFSTLSAAQPDADILVFLEDASEAQRQVQQLKLASVGRLSASIAHEIRNPLGAISHAAQLLRESEQLDHADVRLCEIIQNHCIRMNDVIENVLQMSRRKAAEPERIEIAPWLTRFIEDFTAGFPDTPNITVRLDNEDLTVHADPSHLSQVLGNLCQNGLRYSVKTISVPKLMIVGSVDAQSRPYLEVIDYGTGVPEDDVPNLFEPFYTTETTGTGLGLYLSREMCQANNARLSYAPATTGGAAFRVTFL